MDSPCVNEEKTIIHELTQGLQLAERLKVNLHSPETRDMLLRKILSSFDNALFALQSGDSAGQLPSPALSARSLPESSISFGSQESEEFEFDQPFRGREGENVLSKKRKEPMTWEDEVRICTENGLEGNTDGYSWRKYGQKEIQGAKFPRSYYKCSYRNAQKCLATKHVQRKDATPAVFDIVYKGKHTCHQSASPSPSPPPSPSPSASPSLSPSPRPPRCPSSWMPPSPSPTPTPPPPPPTPPPPQPSHPSPPSLDKHEMLSSLRANLSVNTSDLSGDLSDIVRSSFSFPSASSGVMEDNHQLQFPNFDDESFQVYSPPFISPVTSESNFYSEWGSSQSLDLLADIDTDFEFSSLF